MILAGNPEVAAISCDWLNNRVYGVRLKHRSRGSFAVVKYSSASDSDWVKAANKVLRELGVNSSIYLALGIVLPHSEVFECEVPAASSDVMREALRFEVARHVMSVPEKFRLQYTVAGESETAGMQKVRCAVFPEESFLNFCNQLTQLRSKVDALINPLLALPEDLESSSAVSLHGFEEGFCWQDGMWQLKSDDENKPVNSELDEILKKHLSGTVFEQSDAAEYRTAMITAWYGSRKLFVASSVQSGVTVLPDYMRPARYRTQLRLMALLVLLLAGWAVYRYGGSVIKKFTEHNRLLAQVNNRRSEVQKMRKQIKNGEKELKELQRTAELNIGSRSCMGYLGYISEKLPGEVLVSNFRWAEDVLDINFQSNSEQDMLAFFNQLPGFRVISAPTPRTNPMNNFTTGSVKLSVFDPEQERAKAQLKSLLKSKEKKQGKAKDKSKK